MRVVFFALSLAVITQLVCGYRTYTLNRLCAASNLKLVFDTIHDNQPAVLLETGDYSAAITRQHWNATNLHKASASCHFPVDARRLAPEGSDRGIYASVRQMKLRKNTATGACIDSVSFRHENNLSSPPLCGHHHASNQSHFLVDESGILWVDVYLDKQVPLEWPYDNLAVEIVLTAFEKNCMDDSVRNRTVICSPNHCIARELENDDITNCPPQLPDDVTHVQQEGNMDTASSHQFENKQQQHQHVQQAGVIKPKSGTPNAFSAISSLLMTMICVMCVYSANNSR